MLKKFGPGFAIAMLVASAATAEVFEVHMANKGAVGMMVFEPDFLRVKVGDTIKFIAQDRGHNAESIEGMLPDGAKPFSGKINEEIEVTFDIPGFYGVRCKPHYAMGMAAAIAVGDVTMPDEFLAGRLPKKVKERLKIIISNQ
jgi:pseudoazurin